MKPFSKSLSNTLQQKICALPAIPSPTTSTALSLATSPLAKSPHPSLLPISLLKVGVLSGIMAIATLTTGCSDPHEDGIDPNAKVDIEPTPPLISGQSVTGTNTEIKSVPSLNETNELNIAQDASNNSSNNPTNNLAADPANVVVLEPVAHKATDVQEPVDTSALSSGKAANENMVVTEDSADNTTDKH